MGVNHVEYGGRTIIDIRDKTVTADKLFKGETAKNAAGDDIVGEFTVENEMTEQDALIAQIKSTLAGKAAGGGGGTTPTQEKIVEIAENGTVEITPDDGYALSKVTANVNVPIPDGYIQPSGTKEITENGTHDVTAYASVDVNVEAGGGGDSGGGGSVETFTVINNTDSMLFIGGFMCPNYEPIDIPYPNDFLCTFYVIGEPCNVSYVDDYGDSWSGQVMLKDGGQSAGYVEVYFSAGTTLTFEYME